MTARRAVVLLAAGLVVLGAVSGCGLRERSGTVGDAATPAATSRAEIPDQDPSPADDVTTPDPAPATTAKGTSLTEAQVRAVEAAVGAASKIVSQGEAEVASDG